MALAAGSLPSAELRWPTSAASGKPGARRAPAQWRGISLGPVPWRRGSSSGSGCAWAAIVCTGRDASGPLSFSCQPGPDGAPRPASVRAQSAAALALRKRTAASGYMRFHSRPPSQRRRLSSVTIFSGWGHALFPARSDVWVPASFLGTSARKALSRRGSSKSWRP